MIPQRLGGYRITSHIGEGGMGSVYRAVDELLDREVALKMLRPELAHRAEVAERFRAEAIALAKLDHQHIARVFGMGREGAQVFMVMEFVAGETILSRIERGGRLPWREATAIVTQILDGLGEAHRRGVVHRDIKPANVLVRPDGAVKITDFGIARVVGTARNTRLGHIIGTLEYMSPEQIQGHDVDARTDVYAVGIMLFEMLTGRVPYPATSEYALMQSHLYEPMPRLSGLVDGVPEWFDAIIARATAKSPGDRFASVADFRAELDRHVASEPSVTVKPTRLAKAPARGWAAIAATRLAIAPRLTRLATAGPIAVVRVRLSRRLVTALAAAIVIAGAAASAGLRARHIEGSGPAAEASVAMVGANEATNVASVPTPAPIDLTPRPRPAKPTPAPAPQPAAPPPSSRKPAGPATPVEPVPAPPASSPAPSPVPEPVRAESPVPASPAPVHASMEFEDVVMVIAEGATTREASAVLRLERSRLVITDADSGEVLKTVAYSRIGEATFAVSRQPRWQAGENDSAFTRALSKGLSFLKSTKRWLTLAGAGVSVVLQLDEDNCDDILAALRTHVSVK